MTTALIVLNVVTLMGLCTIVGYFVGKGKVEFVKKVQLSEEEKAKIERAAKEQEEAIEKFNSAIRSLTEYGSGV